MSSTSQTVQFMVRNVGDVDAKFKYTCTPSGVVASITTCPPTLIVANDQVWVPVNVTFTVGASTGSGSISIVAQPVNASGQPIGISAGGIWNETSVAASGTVNPKGLPVLTIPSATGLTQQFTVTNTARAAGTYALAVSCPGTGISGCSLNVASIALDSAGTAGSSSNVTVTYNTAATVDASIVVTMSYNGATLDQGSARISTPSATATPDGTPVIVAPNTTGATQLFNISNTSHAPIVLDLTAACAGSSVSAANCNVFPTILNLDSSGVAAANGQATITYNTLGAGLTGTVTLTVKNVGNTLDQGFVNVYTPNASVTPVSASASPGAGATNQKFVFTVQNTGQVAAAFPISVVCSGLGLSGCSNSPASLSLAIGASLPDTVTYTAGAGGTSGTATLQAKYGAGVLSSGVLTVTPTASGSVSVTPALTTVTLPPLTASSATFTVLQSGGTFPAVYNLTPACTAPGATGCPGSLSPITLTSGAPSQPVTVNFTSGTAASTGQVQLTATLSTNGAITNTGTTAVKVASAAVSANVPTISVAPNVTGLTLGYMVTNNGTVPTTIDLVGVCSGPGGVTACQAGPTQLVNLAVGVPTPANVTYNSQSSGSGTVTLEARYGGVLLASAGTAVTISGGPVPQAPLVAVDSVNPGITVERSLCLTFKVGPNAAVECGDLRIVHSLPATRTMNKVRAPVLIYNSQFARPTPIVTANVTLPGGSLPLDSVVAKVWTCAATCTLKTQGKWSGADWSGGSGPTRRVALSFSALADASGLYKDSLEVTNWFTQGANKVGMSSSRIVPRAVVNYSTSYFGSGWRLAGLEKLSIVGANDTLVWVGGDGSVRRYQRVGAGNTWTAPAVDRPDTLLCDNPCTTYTRLDRGGLKVVFNSSGNHIQTINRAGHVTTFAYASGLLSTITLPVPSGGTSRVYTFGYTAGVLTSVTAPANGATARVFSISRSGTQTTFTDPDTRTVVFNLVAATPQLIQSRVNKLGNTVTYAYQSWNTGKVATVTTTNSPTNLVMSLRPVEGLGLPTAPVPNAVDTAKVYTWLDGLRTDVPDTTIYRVNRDGAPQTITDALGNVTRMARRDARWPALVTWLRRPNGHGMSATYDGRGNPATLTDSGAVVRGVPMAVTSSYIWHPSCDAVTTATPAEGLSFTTVYDALTCTRQSEANGAGATTTFTYWPGTNLLATVQAPGIVGVDSVRYEPGLGNPIATRTPMQFLTTYVQDGVGRDTAVARPIDSLQTKLVRERVQYDIMDRPTTKNTYGPKLTYTQPLTGLPVQVDTANLTVVMTYDFEGELKTTQSTADPDSSAMNSGTTYNYDAAYRQIQRSVAGATTNIVYDAAGNAIKMKMAIGDTIRMTYDTLNRLTRRIVPQLDYAQAAVTPNCPQLCRFPYYANNGTGLRIFADTSTFTYDAVGNQLTANNKWAQVKRTYHPNGWMETDSLRIRGYVSSSFSLFSYGLLNRYNRNGSRVVLKHPAALVGGPADSIWFRYDTATGALSEIRDLGGRQYVYTDDPAGRMVQFEVRPSVGATAGVKEFVAYDPDDRVRLRFLCVLAGAAGSCNTGAAAATAISDSLWYNARGERTRVASFSPGVAPSGQVITMAYGSLGGVAMSFTVNNVPFEQRLEQFRLDALGNAYWTNSNQSNEPPDRRSTFTPEGRLQRVQAITPPPPVPPAMMVPDSLGQNTDLMKNISNRVRRTGTGGTFATISRWEEEREYFGADNRLQFVQKNALGGGTGTAPRTGTFDEFRYDALGRRVLVRSRRDTLANQTNTVSTIDRIVWDGAQILYELRSPGGPLDPLDSGPGSPPFYGSVGYVHGREIDEPIAHTDGRIILHSWRGAAQASTDPAGNPLDCAWANPPNPCDNIDWPAKNYTTTMSGWFPANTGAAFLYRGSLLKGQQDASGLMYRRNRYYDPQTGRFTQVDPGGLGGGLNFYGFANGDQVNFADPFGLCPKDGGGDGKTEVYTDCPAGSSGWYAERERQGRGNSVLNNLGGVLASCAESFFCQATLAVASLGGSLLEGGAEAGAAGASSLYEDITAAGARVANRATNVTRADFETNLIRGGFRKSLSKDGLATILERDGVRYTVRATSRSTQGPTAEFFAKGATRESLKIRLEP